MHPNFAQHISGQLDAIRAAGTWKSERHLSTPRAPASRPMVVLPC